MRLTQLDGLRGWAAFVVLLGHTFQTWLLNPVALQSAGYGGLHDAIYKTPLYLLVDGQFAVQVFFVISGAALSTPVLLSRTPGVSVAELAVFRYPRLAIPVLASCLLAYGLWAAGLLFNAEAGIPSMSSWLGSFYQFGNEAPPLFRFALFDVFFAYDASKTWNAVLWTMPPEMAGSFMIFACLLLARWRAALALLAVAGFLIFARSIYGGFFLGLAIATVLVFAGPRLSLVGLLALTCGLGLAVAVRVFGFPAYRYLMMNVAAALIVFGVCVSPAQRLFAAPISRFMGRISFSLYLVHLLVICSAASALYLAVAPALPFLVTAIVVGGFTIALSLIVAIAFNRVVEEWLVRSAKRHVVGLLGRVLGRVLRRAPGSDAGHAPSVRPRAALPDSN